MGKFLDEINEPKDVKVLNESQLEVLSSEIREFLIDKVSKTGGHLASNLGVVELTLSLFKNFDFEEDKLIWDVGHQSYVHKILTGRKEKFDKLRTFDGLSGFPKRGESIYDSFDTGHSSTSISAALGMARARDVLGKKNKVVAVIGDGALTGGMALEALNDAGDNKTDIIVIINDNGMSIDKNVGGLSSYLSKLRLEPSYNKLKNEINDTLKSFEIGKNIAVSLSKIKDSVKQLVVPSMLFEDMGWKYLGPIDGHDLKELNSVISKAKELNTPVIIHTITKKGKGYEFAEKNPNKYHGVSPFNSINGEINGSNEITYSKAFSNAMVRLSEEREDIVAITAAMPDGTGLKEYSRLFPRRFFDVGIAEQHAVTLAAGMAAEGLKPVFAVYSTFLQRAYDQVLHDVCIQKLPVIFAIDRAGLVGEDGETHQGIFDISYLSHIPNMTIMAPKCTGELYNMLKWSINQNTPIAIRYPRGGDESNNLKPLKEIVLGKWEIIDNGEKVAIISTGKMVTNSLSAKRLLLEDNINPMIINATFIKPLDYELIDYLINNNYKIITIEDNILKGGLGDSVLYYLNKCNYKKSIIQLGYEDEFVEHGDVKTLYKINKLDGKGIRDKVIEIID
ncbi:1-deoxy-D-xylulose-5-phosphate synthase [Clostridium intestinale]|uniref:1-deoxy-D-xylulose-5-phosphate synthase n=1 Tax=Clostridium intestinale TaxID=36845 RepID=UPI0028E74CED|nr:1-deoxy-D-xylulose-5-phosphate synthase [Clostridium intestinale]